MRAKRITISMKELWEIQKMLTGNTDKIMKMTDLANIAAIEMDWPTIKKGQANIKEFSKSYLVKYRDLKRQEFSTGKPCCWVYFVQEGESGPVKIGVSDNVESRLKNLQTGNFRPLFIRASIGFSDRKEAFRFEKSMHKIYSDFSLSGEWFKGAMLNRLDRIQKSQKHAILDRQDRIDMELDRLALSNIAPLFL